MGWFDRVKSAASKVINKVTDVVKKAVTVVKAAKAISDPLLPAKIELAKKVINTAKVVYDKVTQIIPETDKPKLEDEVKDIVRNTDIIREIIAPPAEVPWWKKILSFLSASPFVGLLTNETLFKAGYKLLTGKEMTDTEYELKKLQLADWVLPINLLLKLTQGRNLKGEAEEFGSASDWIESGIYLAGAIIPGQADETAAKFGLKAITKTQADELVAKMGSKTVIDALKNKVKAHPESSAKFLSKFPVSVRNAVIAGLGKTAYGREAIFILGKTGYFKYIAPIWSKALRAAFKFGAISAGIFLPVFALTEIPNYFNMRIFARKSIAQTKGEYAPDFTFQLNEFEKSLQTITFELEKNIKEGKATLAVENIKALESVVANYENYIEEKKEIMFIEDYNLSIELIEFYKRLISDRKEKVITEPIESEEEKWEKIRLEAEERRKAEIVAEEERWQRIQDKADVKKAEARIEDAEYWTKIQDEAAVRAAERKTEEEEYWQRIQDEAETARIEKREEAEEYWARVRIEEEARKAAEALEWKRRLAGPAKGTITINSSPQGAGVYIDGEYTYVETPYTVIFEIGDHLIRLDKDEYVPEEFWIEVEEGDVASVTKTLIKKTEPYKETELVAVTEAKPDYTYSYLYPEIIEAVEPELISRPTERELLINIETTDVKPWKGRIYSIALQDLTTAEAKPIILINNNEEALIDEFLSLFEQINPAKLVGFKLIFDYRFIFSKMMLYRKISKAFYNVGLRDVKQIMDQVKEEFVYFPSKIGTLDDWAKMLLGRGKYGSQELMLRKYIAGDFNYVNAFQLRQINITRELYNLARFVSQEAFIVHSNPITNPIPTQENPIISETPISTQQSQCPVCFSYIDKTTGVCPICKPPI